MITFGQYRVIDIIGKGGMANVYLVVDKSNQKYALKELKREFLKDKIKRKRFRNESRVIKKFDHRNIIKIFEPSYKVTTNNGKKSYSSLIYTMEYFKNKSLKNLISNRKLTSQEIRSIFADLFSALNYCHIRKVYHRDLKPANILLKRVENKIIPCITDFGVAKIKNKEFASGEDLTREVTLLGAPAYMSPEQIMDPRNVDARSDLYSMGVILYELLTGERPFKGSRNDLISQHLNSDPIPPSKLLENIDPELEKMTLQLLDKNPKYRPQSALEIKSQLDQSTISTLTIGKSNYSKKVLNKTKTFVQISLLKNQRRVRTESYEKFPILIGGYNKTKIQNKFNLSPNLPNVEQSHYELFKNNMDVVVLRDRSRLGTIVNGKKIRNNLVSLSKHRLYKIKLPSSVSMEIFIRQYERLSIVIIIIPIVLILVAFTILFILF